MLSQDQAPACCIARTRCATFPRSGNHLLLELLRAYFGDGLHDCDIHKQPERGLDSDPATNFEKTHDLKLLDPIDGALRHIVQVRFPTDAIASWYTMACTQNHPDNPTSWQTYAIQVSSFWLRFYRKWVLNPVPNRLVVGYDDLVDHPSETLAQVVEHLTDQPADLMRARDACNGRNIGRRNSYRNFKYYGDQFGGFMNSLFCTTPGVDIERSRIDSASLNRHPVSA